MDLARITDDERARRLFQIDRLVQDGYSDSAISTELGLSIDVVKRSQKYLENIKTADITPELLAEKRSELYLEFNEIAAEAKKQYELYKEPRLCGYCKGVGEVSGKKDEGMVTCGKCKGQGAMHNPRDANRFLVTWTQVIERKAKLFGLDNIRNDNVIQFNQFNQNNEYVPELKLTGAAKQLSKQLATALKESHEKSKQ